MKYAITIKAVVTKTYIVEGPTEEQAIAEAHSDFNVLNEEGVDEHYDQYLLSVEEVDTDTV